MLMSMYSHIHSQQRICLLVILITRIKRIRYVCVTCSVISQVIDTPGILDHPLEERNTIEMQAITALAHLRGTVLFLVDLSESCGFPIEQQVCRFLLIAFD